MKPLSTLIRNVSTTSLSIILLSASLMASSDIVKKPSLKKAVTPTDSNGIITETKDNSGSLKRGKTTTADAIGQDTKGKSMKKNAAKKVGVAAAAGVAGSVVKSKLKN